LKKLTEIESKQYWINTHSKVKGDLASVCFPDKPLYFNLFFDRVQRYALNKFFRKEELSFEGKRVLDIGCGRGRWLLFYEKKHKAVVTGIDLSKDAVHVCDSKGFKVCQGSIAELPFEDMCFDFVNSITVLMHLRYELKEKAIAEISRVLKPSGKAILIEGTWKDPSTHVYGLDTSEWEKRFGMYDMRLVHKSGHCFNLFRIKLPLLTPFRDFLAIHLDYPLEFALMGYFYGKESEIALQHVMIFEK
jgi:SAM-dependent methyltransferase